MSAVSDGLGKPFVSASHPTPHRRRPGRPRRDGVRTVDGASGDGWPHL